MPSPPNISLPFRRPQRQARHWNVTYLLLHVHTQSCPTLYDPTDCSPPGSSVHGILRARILEWVAISFSRGSSQPRNQTQVSCMAGRFFTIWATREAKNTGVACHFLVQVSFRTQGMNPHLFCLLHWQANLYPALPGKPIPDLTFILINQLRARYNCPPFQVRRKGPGGRGDNDPGLHRWEMQSQALTGLHVGPTQGSPLLQTLPTTAHPGALPAPTQLSGPRCPL